MTDETLAASVASFHPVDPGRWTDLVRIFEHHGNPGYCWCMRWRVPSGEFNSLKKEGRQAALHGHVTAGEPIGILGYLEGEPVGWCSVAPRTSFVALERSRVLKRLDDQPVWAVVCFFLDRRVRGRGFARDLLQAAVAFARAQGATVVEGYPAEPGATSYRWMGSLATFQAAGFHEASPAGNGRRIMRYIMDQTG